MNEPRNEPRRLLVREKEGVRGYVLTSCEGCGFWPMRDYQLRYCFECQKNLCRVCICDGEEAPVSLVCRDCLVARDPRLRPLDRTKRGVELVYEMREWEKKRLAQYPPRPKGWDDPI